MDHFDHFDFLHRPAALYTVFLGEDKHTMSEGDHETNSQDDVTRGVAVAAMLGFWCCVGAAVYAIRRCKKKHVDAAVYAETAIVV